ncbi:FAD-dependent oxidoreductase [Actinoplanes couchii]|uniref:Flavin-dependent monooxygenase n=1 Tax=Actinoplanes couchii TaxID=403638 RepID=A0ABQ3XRX4_9ACTN|nr:NAD(P)/FAD-dependent oxidoreductase [Actinoplanes couchii]MDR6318744.1 2-polyprenyl-6-methoxyphenol hydroxylase-like FAD-dependent oxidoreductase [Actinoplanes couchii]GID61272.1 oxidoreductase [Actinoplanes couchii]
MSRSTAIVGAGLSGLVLARILQEHGITATVYESDAGPAARRQGGQLDIHHDSGQQALRAAGLHDEFLRHVHPQAEHARILDRDGHVHLDAAGGGGRPEIDRTALRDLLIGSLDPGRIRWGHKVTAARTLDDGRHELTFADGTATAADLLIGADGTWSRVRPLLSEAVPAYAGITHFEVEIPDARNRHPDLAATVGPGMIFALGGDDRAILGHGGDHLELGVSFRAPQDWLRTSGVDRADPAAARAALISKLSGWSGTLTDLVRACDDTITARQIFALPPGHSWPRVPGLTLVGDAAHVMSPYAGEGANLALQDGAELALALIENPGDPEKALDRYEQAMVPRARAAAEMSAANLNLIFGPDAARQLAAFFSTPHPEA